MHISSKHLPYRSWCDHCVRGKAVDDAHRPRIDPHRSEAKMGMDHFLLARATDPQHAGMDCLDFQLGAVFSGMVVKGDDPHALAVALEAIKFTGRTRLIIMSDQENAVLGRSLGFLVVTNFPPPQYPLSLGRNFPCCFSFQSCLFLLAVSTFVESPPSICSPSLELPAAASFSSCPSFSAVLPLQH